MIFSNTSNRLSYAYLPPRILRALGLERSRYGQYKLTDEQREEFFELIGMEDPWRQPGQAVAPNGSVIDLRDRSVPWTVEHKSCDDVEQLEGGAVECVARDDAGLWDHQVEGIQYLVQRGGSGFLAHEPGLGKTRTVIEYLKGEE